MSLVPFVLFPPEGLKRDDETKPTEQQEPPRGRNNNGGRKHLNPLSRNYESNGPDVKVRGNASHVAEKYLQLARDAQSSGDSVMAENYLQHAEHYFRIVAAAQAQQNQPRDQFGQPQGGAIRTMTTTISSRSTTALPARAAAAARAAAFRSSSHSSRAAEPWKQ
jgi:hypothetical protein